MVLRIDTLTQKSTVKKLWFNSFMIWFDSLTLGLFIDIDIYELTAI